MSLLGRRYCFSKSATLTSFFFCIFPLYTLPWVIRGMIRQEKYAFVLWAIFMGLLGILYPPVGDLYRYTQDYYIYKDCDWNLFVKLLTLRFDFLLSFLSYFIGKLGLNFDFTRFLFNFSAFYLIGNIYLDICKNNKQLRNNTKIGVYIVFFFIAFSFSTYLYRFFFSMILFVYGGYQIVYKRKKSGWIYVFLSIINHFAFIVFLVTLVLQQLRFFRFKRWIVLMFILIALFLNNTIVAYLFSMLPLEIVNRYSAYIDGNWAKDFLEDHSWKFRLMLILNSVIIYVGCIVYVLSYKRGKSAHLSFTNSILVLAFLTLPFVVIHGRFLIVLLFAIKIYFLSVYDGSRIMKFYLKCMFWCVMLGNVMGVWSDRRPLAISEYSRVLYSTSFQILTFSYSEHWIDKNITPEGDISKIDY